MGKDHCRLAKTLVEYDRAVDAAMAHVFGRTLVCDDMDMAKKVTYDPKVKARTVTLAGEDFNPSGTLSGGQLISASVCQIHLLKNEHFLNQIRH